jgi:hypothetical protein
MAAAVAGKIYPSFSKNARLLRQAGVFVFVEKRLGA